SGFSDTLGAIPGGNSNGSIPATTRRRNYGRHGSLFPSDRDSLRGVRDLLLLAHLHQGGSRRAAGASDADPGNRRVGGSVHSCVRALERGPGTAGVRRAAALSSAVSPGTARAAGTTVATLVHTRRRGVLSELARLGWAEALVPLKLFQ